MVTRRTIQRTHLLRPDAAVSQLFKYCLGVIAQRHGILVHAAVLMSTHEHIVLTDTKGSLPNFLQELHRIVALGVKVLRNWDGAVWDQRKTSVVELRTPNAILEKIAYVMANPVAAGLVVKAEDWPGVTTLPTDLGTARWSAERPAYYFSVANENWPAEAVLDLTVPPSLQMGTAELQSSVASALSRLVSEALEQVRALGARAGNPKALCKTSPFARAQSAEPRGALNPTVAVGHGARQALLDALRALREFRNSHRLALEKWRGGARDALFPAGTWLMRRLHGANVAVC